MNRIYSFLIFMGNTFTIRTWQFVLITSWIYLLLNSISVANGKPWYSGFTLIEALLFLTITILLTLYTFPNFGGISEDDIVFWKFLKKVEVGNQNYYLLVDELNQVSAYIDLFIFRKRVFTTIAYIDEKRLIEILREHELKRIDELNEEKEKIKLKKKYKERYNFKKVYLTKEDERLDKLKKI